MYYISKKGILVDLDKLLTVHIVVLRKSRYCAPTRQKP